MELEARSSFCESIKIFGLRFGKMLCRSNDDQRAGSFLKQRISKALQISNATSATHVSLKEPITLNCLLELVFFFSTRRLALVLIFFLVFWFCLSSGIVSGMSRKSALSFISLPFVLHECVSSPRLHDDLHGSGLMRTI